MFQYYGLKQDFLENITEIIIFNRSKLVDEKIMTSEQVEAQLDKIENMTFYASDRKVFFRERSTHL